MNKRIMLRIDGQYVTTDRGRTILEVARENGITIPSLCAVEGLTAVGSCRLCLVEIKGNDRLLPACTVQVEGGMVIATRSEKLDAYRRMIVALLFAERNHVCAVCVSNGRCELQSLARDTGMTHVDFTFRYPKQQVDATHERFVLDENRCVLCTRCVRACDELEGVHTWDVGGRGIQSHLLSELGMPWGAAERCTGCGKCVSVCPTGALAEKGHAVGESYKREWIVADLARIRGGKR